MAIGTRASMWDPRNGGTAALSLRAAPCTHAPSGQGLMFSAISSCFSSRPSRITFISRMPQRAVSHPGESGNAVEDRIGKVGCGRHSLPCKLSPPWHLHLPPLHSWKNHLGEETTLLSAMWEVCPVKGKGLTKFLPSGCCQAAQYPKGCGRRDLRSDHISDCNQ